MAWVFLTVYRKMQEEREKLKELLSKKEAELEDLGNSHSVHKVKNGKACSEENMKGVSCYEINKQKHCQLPLKRGWRPQNEESLLNLDSTGRYPRAIWLYIVLSFKKRKEGL